MPPRKSAAATSLRAVGMSAIRRHAAGAVALGPPLAAGAFAGVQQTTTSAAANTYRPSVRQVRKDSDHVRRVAFLLWLFAFLVCLAFLGFIAFGYLGNALDRFPKLG